uniref:Transposase n=1 Tax=Strongyloides papillosus TaxID=174720 RepID=A0A0N5BFS2_STREA
MTHLPHVVKNHGPINTFSTFAGESSLHDLNSMLSSLSLENVLTQITKRLDDRWYYYEKTSSSIADLKNTNYFSKLSNGKILNKICSNLERSSIDQDIIKSNLKEEILT